MQLETLSSFDFSEKMKKEELKETQKKLELAVKTAAHAKGIADSILEVGRLQLDATRLACEYNLKRNELPETMNILIANEKVS